MSTAIYKEAAAPCANCGAASPGSFCPSCGEEQPGHHDYSLHHFFHELFHEFVHLDSRLFRTLKALLFQPGSLTAEYFAGRKARYFRPLRLFLVIFALNFFVYSLYRPVTTYDFGRVLQAEQSGLLAKMLDRKAEKLHTTREEIAERVGHRWGANVSLLQLLSVFLLAIILKLVYLPKNRFYVEHLVFALHLYSFNMLWAILIWPLFYAAGTIDPFGKTAWVTFLTFSVGSVYVFQALKRVYQDGPGTTFYRTLLVLVGAQICFGITVTVAIIAAMLQILR